MSTINPSYRPTIFLAGNFLSGRGLGRSPIEDLAEKLSSEWDQIRASHFRNGLLRGMHLLLTALLRRPQYRIGVVDVYSGRAFLWAELLSLLLKALGCHFIITMHGGALPEFSRRWPRRVRACLKRATFVTAPSNYLLTEMRPYRSDAHLIPNPLDIEDYPFRLRAVAAPRLIWLRRFRDVYNPELAPRIVARLVGEFPDVQLTMVGPDWGDGSLERTKRAAGRLGVAYRIQYTGGIDRREVPTSLNAADIFLNTTNFDNSPVSVIEAMACGLCIVTTGVGGIPYLVTDGEDALVVPKNDPEAAAKAVRRILTDPGLASTISANARRKAEHFDWSIVLPQWKSLLRAAEQY